MRTCAMAVLVVGILVLTLPARPQTVGSQGEDRHHFENSAVSFEYGYPMVLCQAGAQACPGCESPSTVIACVSYDKKVYARYNISDGPRLSIAVLDNVHDQAKCVAFPEDELTSKLPDQQFNGVTFKSALHTEGAMSHSYRTYFYRAFHNGRCYDLELFLATVNAGVYDASERPKEFTAAEERKVVNNFKRMLNSLHLSGA